LTESRGPRDEQARDGIPGQLGESQSPCPTAGTACRRARTWAEQCAWAAFEAGIQKEELEEDFGSLKNYLRLAITDEAAIRSEAEGG
jgi:hypothetical protein